MGVVCWSRVGRNTRSYPGLQAHQRQSRSLQVFRLKMQYQSGTLKQTADEGRRRLQE